MSDYKKYKRHHSGLEIYEFIPPSPITVSLEVSYNEQYFARPNISGLVFLQFSWLFLWVYNMVAIAPGIVSAFIFTFKTGRKKDS